MLNREILISLLKEIQDLGAERVYIHLCMGRKTDHDIYWMVSPTHVASDVIVFERDDSDEPGTGTWEIQKLIDTLTGFGSVDSFLSVEIDERSMGGVISSGFFEDILNRAAALENAAIDTSYRRKYGVGINLWVETIQLEKE